MDIQKANPPGNERFGRRFPRNMENKKLNAYLDRYIKADDRLTGYFRESESYEEWLLKCKADEDVSDYIGYMIDLGMKNEREVYTLISEFAESQETDLDLWNRSRR